MSGRNSNSRFQSSVLGSGFSVDKTAADSTAISTQRPLKKKELPDLNEFRTGRNPKFLVQTLHPVKPKHDPIIVEHFPFFPPPPGTREGELGGRLVSIQIDGADLTNEAFTTRQLKPSLITSNTVSRTSVTQGISRGNVSILPQQKEQPAFLNAKRNIYSKSKRFSSVGVDQIKGKRKKLRYTQNDLKSLGEDSESVQKI